jgi:hypothetical protein
LRNLEKANKEARNAAERSAKLAFKVNVESFSATRMHTNIRLIEKE